MRSVARHLYYRIKPFVPWKVRIAIRRLLVRRLLERHRDVWPIHPGSGAAPRNWPGWPEGKRFAFVLTHDVEAAPGVDQCRALADLEASQGFRSSFNFIPEGTYQVSSHLRHWLTDKGFEVGIHDLHHDGKLYDSREGFRQKARRINHYLKKWNACGFRSGFMLHRLEWLHDLEIAYDASTFDTDPFEPQPDGTKTIFPFWVSGPDGKGYVELPYTLPQDSTLFILFGEKSVDLWKQKIDWLVEHGGMVLINIHPDYVCFNGVPKAERALPAAQLEGLLDYVRTKYRGEYWQPLPRDLAFYYRESAMNPSLLTGANNVSGSKLPLPDLDATPRS